MKMDRRMLYWLITCLRILVEVTTEYGSFLFSLALPDFRGNLLGCVFRQSGQERRGGDVPGRLYLFLAFTWPAFQRRMEQLHMSNALRLKRSRGTGLDRFIVDSRQHKDGAIHPGLVT